MSYCARPTRRFPAPMAHRISVVVGFSETIRAGALPVGIALPKSSTILAALPCARSGERQAPSPMPITAIGERTRLLKRNTGTQAMEEDTRNAETRLHASV